MEQNRLWSRIKPYGMIAPAMAGIVLFTLYPALNLVHLSLQDVNMLNAAKTRFVGLRNYREIFAREAFHKALSNTAVYTAAVVILIIRLALLLAVCLNQKKSKLNDLVLASAFSPHVISIVSVSVVCV